MFRIFLGTAMININYNSNYKIILLKKDYMIIKIKISRGKMDFYLYRFYIYYTTLSRLFVLWLHKAIFKSHHTHCSSGKRCGPWASCYLVVRYNSIDDETRVNSFMVNFKTFFRCWECYKWGKASIKKTWFILNFNYFTQKPHWWVKSKCFLSI